jgi:NAD-dependent SIR2 family protein deacetylase
VDLDQQLTGLRDFVVQHPRLLVLTGAGVSTASGIPDYRDERGEWKLARPLQFQDFRRSALVRQRYWARSLIGWPRFKLAAPSRAHRALATMEQRGHIADLITQNVDGLHQSAGSRHVIDLHGRLDRVICLDCGQRSPRQALQSWLLDNNPQLADVDARPAPDGDAMIDNLDFASVRVPDCEQCGGLLKPDVVFFGENVPASRVEQGFDAVQGADAMLVVGSSLMVYSGFRFVKRAYELGKPVAAINRGITRADDLLALRIVADCNDALDSIATRL